MNETHGFSKQHNVAFTLERCFSTLHGFFASFYKSKIADQITEG